MIRSVLRLGARRAMAPARALRVNTLGPAPLSAAPHRGFATETINIKFLDMKNNETTEVTAPVGKTIFEIVQDQSIDLECSCEGTLACSTCHVILDQTYFDKLPAPEEEELDMLDLAADVTPLSRLGCQIVMKKELDGMVVTMPANTADAR